MQQNIIAVIHFFRKTLEKISRLQLSPLNVRGQILKNLQ